MYLFQSDDSSFANCKNRLCLTPKLSRRSSDDEILKGQGGMATRETNPYHSMNEGAFN